MDTSQPAEVKSSLFASSILRPSVLSTKPPVTISPEKSSQSQTPSPPKNETSPKPLVEKPSLNSFKNATVPAPVVTTPANNTGYVFGQNMLSRVVNAQEVNSLGSANLWQSAAAVVDKEGEEPTVFTALAKAVATKIKQPSGPTELKDSADELARKRSAAQLQFTEEQPVTTGEEGERTVIELTCNAYVFNIESRQWTSIGQSYLHLNDGDSGESRLVIRLQSTRRVVVNTPIWPEMPLATVMESKGLRFGAVEAGGGAIRSYLLRFPMAASASQLYKLLLTRRDEAVERFTSKRARLTNSVVCSPPTITLTPPDTSDIVTGEQVKPSVNEEKQEDKEEEDVSSKVFTLPPKIEQSRFVNGASGTPVLNLPCRVRVSSTSGKQQVEDCSEKMEASVQVIDFPTTGGPSILEVTPSSSKLPILTTIVGLRLAFCLPPELDGGRTLQVFLLPYPSSTTESAEHANTETSLIKVYQVELFSQGAADRLYRCLLLRLSRLFTVNEPSTASASSGQKRQIWSDQSSDSISKQGDAVEKPI